MKKLITFAAILTVLTSFVSCSKKSESTAEKSSSASSSVSTEDSTAETLSSETEETSVSENADESSSEISSDSAEDNSSQVDSSSESETDNSDNSSAEVTTAPENSGSEEYVKTTPTVKNMGYVYGGFKTLKPDKTIFDQLKFKIVLKEISQADTAEGSKTLQFVCDITNNADQYGCCKIIDYVINDESIGDVSSEVVRVDPGKTVTQTFNVYGLDLVELAGYNFNDIKKIKVMAALVNSDRMSAIPVRKGEYVEFDVN